MLLAVWNLLKRFCFGAKPPRPTGSECPELKAAALAVCCKKLYRLRVAVWCVLTFRSQMDWDRFVERMQGSQFRRFGSWREMRGSVGFIDLLDDKDPTGPFLLAVAGHWIPCLGTSIISHEVFHGVQHHKSGICNPPYPHRLRRIVIELAANVFGGPLFFSAFLVGVAGISVLIYLLADWMFSTPFAVSLIEQAFRWFS